MEGRLRAALRASWPPITVRGEVPLIIVFFLEPPARLVIISVIEAFRLPAPTRIRDRRKLGDVFSRGNLRVGRLILVSAVY